jgi:hypothetical protein
MEKLGHPKSSNDRKRKRLKIVLELNGEVGLKNYPIDQIANLIRDLKTNPDSRRLMVSAWNVGELDQMTTSTLSLWISSLYKRVECYRERYNLIEEDKQLSL